MQATQSKNATEKSSKRCDIYVLASGSTRKGRYGIDQKKQGWFYSREINITQWLFINYFVLPLTYTCLNALYSVK